MLILKKILFLFLFIIFLAGNVFAEEFSQDISVVNPFMGSPELQAYSLQVGKKIISNFDMPQTDENFSTIVTFKVDKNGKLINYEITQTSGNKDYDNRVVSAIKKASPYPAPDFQDGDEVGVILNMDLNILKLIKMLSESNLDFDFNSNFVPQEIFNQAEEQTPQKNIDTTQKQNSSGKKFVNPYDIEKSLE